jgi:hypothetical protein
VTRQGENSLLLIGGPAYERCAALGQDEETKLAVETKFSEHEMTNLTCIATVNIKLFREVHVVQGT